MRNPFGLLLCRIALLFGTTKLHDWEKLSRTWTLQGRNKEDFDLIKITRCNRCGYYHLYAIEKNQQVIWASHVFKDLKQQAVDNWLRRGRKD